MRSAALTLLLRAALYVAIVASAALLSDYQQEGGAGFCGVVSGCAEVRASPYAAPMGIPLPTLGLGTFLGLYLLAIWASRKRHVRWLAAMCTVAALGAITLIAIMVFELDAVCEWCMAVDVGAIVAAACALALVFVGPPSEPVGQRLLWTGAAVAAVVITIAWGQGPRYQPPPPDVASLQVPGKVTLVVFSDFQCPFCRLLHPVLREVSEQHPQALRTRLVPVPLPAHPGADLQARAYLCTPEDQRVEVADEFYELAVDELVYQAVEQAAADAGVDTAAYAERLDDESEQRKLGQLLGQLIVQQAAATIERAGGDTSGLEACITSDETAAELQRGLELFQRTGLTGLPSIYVQNFLVQGADESLLRAAVVAALEGGKGRDVRWMCGALAALFFAVAGVGLLRARRRGLGA